MSDLERATFVGAAAVLLFDIAASFVCRVLRAKYANARWGSLLIYFLVGVIASRSTKEPMNSLLAGAIVGLIDSTLGWWLSMLIEPGRFGRRITPRIWAMVSVRVSSLAASMALCGYAISALGRWLKLPH